MRTVSECLFTLLIGGLAAFAPAAFATTPGTNGHIAYTKILDKDVATHRHAIFIDGAQVTSPEARDDASDDDSFPAYSPDGTQLAYIRHKGDTNDYVFYVAKADGTLPRQLAVLSDLDVAQWGIPNASTAQALVWSPDGKAIGFLRKYVVPPFYADAIYTVSPVDGVFQRISDAPTGGMPFAGFDWQGGAPGKVGSLVDSCVSMQLNTLFCLQDDMVGNFQGVTTYVPRADVPPARLILGVPRWQPDSRGGRTRVMFSLDVPIVAGSYRLDAASIFSILPSDGSTPDSAGSDLEEYTPGREVVSCPAKNNGNAYTAYATRYGYANPFPSPDGKYFLAVRSEIALEPDPHPFIPENVVCYARTLSNDLYVFRNDGGIQQDVDTDVDASFGIAWQPSPANVVINVTDGRVHELHGAVVELRDSINPEVVAYSNPLNSSGGQYLFDGVAPGRYLVRVTLDDAQSDAFEVRHDFPADKAAWAQRSILIPAGSEKVEKDFAFNDGVDSASVEDMSQWDHLDAMAAIFFETHRFVDWVHTNLTPTTGAKVTIHAFAANDGSNPVETTFYSHGSIFISVADSAYSNRDGSGDAPVNVEWHEFAHHLDRTFIYSGLCAGVNHDGYRNPDTCDSMREGIATFLAASVNGSPDYAHIFDLEAQTKAWGLRLAGQWFSSTEDEAVAALLWDIVDGYSDSESTLALGLGGAHLPVGYADDVSMPLRSLWTVLTAGGGTVTVSDLRTRLDAGSPLTVDLDYDGLPDVTTVDELFLMHGFFPIASDQFITATHQTFHYNVEGIGQNNTQYPPNFNVGQTGHDAFSYHSLTAPAQNPRENLAPATAANLSISAHDAAGRELQGVQITMTVHYPGFDRALDQTLPTGNGRSVHLELPNYFDYLPAPGQTAPPPCDPEHDVYVSVTLTASINGYASTNSHGFDNCSYIQAQLAATGSTAASYEMSFPEDAAPPVTQIDTSATGNVAGQYTDGTWTVTLLCRDPVVSNFAAGCLTTQYSIDGGDYVRYGQEVTISTPGLHTFSYLSRDAAGNAEAVRTVTLGIAGQIEDETAPVTTANAVASVPPDSNNATTGFWTVSLSCTDPPGASGAEVSGCEHTEFSLDGSEFAPYTTPVEIHDVGQHVLRFFSADVRGTYEQPPKSISLEIKEAEVTVSVPDVAGLTQSAAAGAITNVGLMVGNITQQPSITVAAGIVISQDPSAGMSVIAGSAINLLVSTGPPPVSVPSIVGLAQAAASSAITNAGLVVGTITQQSSSTVAAGNVISQSPSAGTSVGAKSSVNLVVSTGVASGSSFDTLKAVTQGTKIAGQGLKGLLIADINTALALYTHDRPLVALAAMEVYQALVRAASGHSISKADATNLLTLSDAVERDIRARLPRT